MGHINVNILPVGEKVKTAREGRKCRFKDCKVTLSIYNHGKYCFLHSQEKMLSDKMIRVLEREERMSSLKNLRTGDTRELTWKCHICGRTKPDNKISVLQKPLVVNGMEMGTQNIRYCNDNPDCFRGAENFSFLKDGNKK